MATISLTVDLPLDLETLFSGVTNLVGVHQEQILASIIREQTIFLEGEFDVFNPRPFEMTSPGIALGLRLFCRLLKGEDSLDAAQIVFSHGALDADLNAMPTAVVVSNYEVSDTILKNSLGESFPVGHVLTFDATVPADVPPQTIPLLFVCTTVDGEKFRGQATLRVKYAHLPE